MSVWTEPLSVNWHRWRTHHRISVIHVTPPRWDRSAIGILWRCECGRKWAR